MSKIRPFLAIALLGCQSAPAQGPAPRSPTPPAREDVVRVETVASGLAHPWGFAFLPDGPIIVTERSGGVRLIDRAGKVTSPLAGAPRVAASGQGGMLDVALDPGFAQNRTVYLSFSEPGDGGAGTAVARMQLGANALENVQVIYRQEPKVSGSGHFGSRIVFSRDGKLFITQGDRFNHRERAQDLSTTIGKVVRINPDGSFPTDNPFAGTDTARADIWTYGHRNSLAAAFDASGRLWTLDMGARGGDELNLNQRGKNYGWPYVSDGDNYSGPSIPDHSTRRDITAPVRSWTPVIAPSGALFYSGAMFPTWRGSLLVGGLATQSLIRLQLDGEQRVAIEERVFMGRRIRDVAQAPDGSLFVIVDDKSGDLLRLSR